LMGYLTAILALAHGVTARWLGGADKHGRAVLAYLVLLVAFSLAAAVPVVGWAIGLLATLAGVGAWMQRLAAARRAGQVEGP
ncbi:MAG: hypothetical protein D6782_05375, partial [Alphaproteobacteria bacterium]